MDRRQFLSAVALSGLLAGCGGGKHVTTPSPTPKQQTDLTIGLTYIPDVQFSPFYVAEQRNYFADRGLNVTLRHHGQSESLFGALNSGEEHIVFAGGDEMMVARSEGTDVVNFATMYQTYPVRLIVKDDSAIRELADLKGHSVALPGPFGENWYFLLALLNEAGLTQDDVTIMNVGYTQQSALATGRADSIIGFVNNDVVQLTQQGVHLRAIELETQPLVGVGLGCTTATLQQHGAALTALVEGVRQALNDIEADPQVAIEASKPHVAALRTDEAAERARKVLAATVPLYGNPDQAGTQSGDTWEKMSTFLADAKLVKQPVAAQDAYTAEVLP